MNVSTPMALLAALLVAACTATPIEIPSADGGPQASPDSGDKTGRDAGASDSVVALPDTAPSLDAPIVGAPDSGAPAPMTDGGPAGNGDSGMTADGAAGDGMTADGAAGDGAMDDGAMGDGAMDDGAMGDGAMGDDAMGDGAMGDDAMGDDAMLEDLAPGGEGGIDAALADAESGDDV